MAKAQQSIIVSAPPKRIFDIITDYERYPEFLPDVKAVKVLSRRKAQADVEMEVDVLRRIRYSISLIERPYASVEWTLKESSVFKTNSGGWYLEPLGRSKTEVTYVADIGFPLPIPKSLSNMILQVRLPKMLELFKQRAEADHANVASAR